MVKFQRMRGWPTGALIEGRDLATRQVVLAWAAYGEPLVWDFTGDGRAEIVLQSADGVVHCLDGPVH